MTSPVFRTTEVAQLYEEVSAWCHPENPFLDPNYSSGSKAPAIDLTPYVTTWLSEGREDAIAELWRFLTPSGDGYFYSLSKALEARLPAWVHLSETARHELRAILLLTLRSALITNQDMSSVGIRLAATTLACREIEVDLAAASELARLFQCKSQEPEGCSSDSNEESDAELKLALGTAVSPLGVTEVAAERLKAVPPMVRCVVSDFILHGWSESTLRYDLCYGERMDGCGKEANQQYVEWLGFFGRPSDHAVVPTAVTKDILREALQQHGIQCKKSTTRGSMLENAHAIPGLLSALISRHWPQQRELLPEWKQSVSDWAHRAQSVEVVAAMLINFMARSAINERCTSKAFFNGVRSELLFKTITFIAHGADRFITDQTDLDEYPAWELSQTYEREVVENDWPARWYAAAAQAEDDQARRVLDKTGQMIGLKSSRIWQALGDGAGGYDNTLGNPWPPFALDSGYDVSGVPRNECEKLGLLNPRATPKGSPFDFSKLHPPISV